MDNSFTYVPYPETGYFSRLVNDYVSDDPNIQPFYQYTPDAAGLDKAIEDRSRFPVNRQALVTSLKRQYENLPKYDKTEQNIALLVNENTFTVCTAHQPNLLTGYLYFIYKILHAIKLAEQLKAQYPDKHFVPVYYMGSEDNDIEELGTFRFRGDKYVWDGDGQSGAVGRMSTKGLKPLLNQLLKVLGPPGANCTELQEMLTAAYLQHNTIAAATQYLVNELFGRFGLVVLNPDEAELKATYIHVMQDELMQQQAYGIISLQIENLAIHYKIQAHPRHINLFYLADQLRERIEFDGTHWVALNTTIKWTKEEILSELQAHPERFSPNVMLRGMYQETILPDVAFIGGGAEVAYWLQLKTLFLHYNVFYPVILLRQSVLWIGGESAKRRAGLELKIPELFEDYENLVRDYISKHSGNEWQTAGETTAIENIFDGLKQKATSLDPTLTASTEAALTKMRYQLNVLEKKMLRAEKRKEAVALNRIEKLKNELFPMGSLQERIENFSEYFLVYGAEFFDTILKGIEPLSARFLVIEQSMFV